MSADSGIDRTMVHAGPATDAKQSVAQKFVFIHPASAVVQQDQVHFLGSVFFTFLPWTTDHVEVGRDRLAGSGTGEDCQQRREILEFADDLFNAHHGNVNPRHGGTKAPVSFIFNQTQGSCFCDCEIYTGNAKLGSSEFVSQNLSCRFRHFFGSVTFFCRCNLLLENLRNFFPVFVDRGHDDMGRQLMIDLDDVFTKIRF